MIIKTRSAMPDCVHVIFELPSCLWAEHICLLGEFNNWKPDTMLMQQAHNGVWRIELDLPCGHTYEFRYLVDNHWLTDNHADGLATNRYGAQNSIVDTTLPITLLEFGGGKKPEWAKAWRKAPHLPQVD